MNDLITLPKCRVSLTGIECADDMTWQEWVETMRRAVKVKEAMQWVVGGLLNFAMRRWVESASKQEKKLWMRRYQTAIDSLPYEPETLRVYAYVDKRLSPVIRITKLSFRHHQCVAPLEPAKQKKYLQIAAKEGFTVADLNELIRNNEAEYDGDDAGPKSEEGPMEWINHGALWCQQQDPSTWPKAKKEVIKRDLRPYVELYERL